jgi:hypothetical protein
VNQNVKHPMRMSPARMAHFNWGRVDEGNAGHFAFASVQKTTQQQQAPGYQLHEVGVADQVRESTPPARQRTQGVEVLEGAIPRVVKGNHDRHPFTQVQA